MDQGMQSPWLGDDVVSDAAYSMECPYCHRVVSFGSMLIRGMVRKTCGERACILAHKAWLKKVCHERDRQTGRVYPSYVKYECPICGKKKRHPGRCVDCMTHEKSLKRVVFECTKISFCKYCNKSHRAHLACCRSAECRKKHNRIISKRDSDRTKERRANDPQYRAIFNERARRRALSNIPLRIRMAVSANINKRIHRFIRGGNPGAWRWLPYTPADLVNHLESQFVFGMGWHNYGKEWHIDHIVPHSWFKIERRGDQQFLRAWALNNLMPRFATDKHAAMYGGFMTGNLEKSDKYAGKN